MPASSPSKPEEIRPNPASDAAEDAQKENLNRQIATLEEQHERAEEALENLKDAEIAQWQSYQEPVRTAMNELTTSVNQVIVR